MRCELCQGIDLSTAGAFGRDGENFGHQPAYQHQPSLNALTISAEGGCDLCAVFLSEFQRFEQPFQKVAEAAARGASTAITVAKTVSRRVSNFIGPLKTEHQVPTLVTFDVKCGDYGGPALEVFCEEGSEVSKSLQICGRPIACSPLENEVILLIRSWMEVCIDKHALCERPKRSEMPTRLIDLTREPVRIFNPADETKEYACLSHCWGGVASQRLLSSNWSSLMEGLSQTDLPQNFQDAITVCQRLGIQYLWIDSLCILQDDPEDWEREAAKMRSYYANSILTIAATVAKNSEAGFLSRRHNVLALASIPYKDQHMDSLGLLYIRQPVPGWIDDVNGGALNMRGWTCQERLLSRRVLHFGTSQCFWECATCSFAEGGLRPYDYPAASVKRRFSEKSLALAPAIDDERRSYGAATGLGRRAAENSSDEDDARSNRSGENKSSETDDSDIDKESGTSRPSESSGSEDVQQSRVFTVAKALGLYEHQPASIQDTFYHRDTSHSDVIVDDTNLFKLEPYEIGEPGLDSAIEKWFEIVREYTRRHLTYKTDFFPAMSGLINLFAESTGDDFHAGIWRNDVLRGLLWRPLYVRLEEGDDYDVRPLTFTELSISPTWSWSNIDGPCYYNTEYLRVRDTNHDAKILLFNTQSLRITLDDGRPLDIYRSMLCISGRLFPVKVCDQKPNGGETGQGLEMSYSWDLETSGGTYLGQAYLPLGADVPFEMSALVLGRWVCKYDWPHKVSLPDFHGLILAPNKDGPIWKNAEFGEAKEWLRIGSFESAENDLFRGYREPSATHLLQAAERVPVMIL